MREIDSALGCQRLIIPASSAGYAEFMDIERQESSSSLRLRREPTRTSSARDDVDERLDYVTRRLAEELGEGKIDAVGSFDASHNGRNCMEEKSPPAPTNFPPEMGVSPNVSVRRELNSTEPGAESRDYSLSYPDKEDGLTPVKRAPPDACIRSLRRVFDDFCVDQHDTMVQCLCDGQLHGGDDTLRLLEPLPSIKATYQYRYVPSADGPETRSSSLRPRRRRRSWMDEALDDGRRTPGTPATPEEKQGDIYYEMAREKTKRDHTSDEITAASHHSLMRVYSFLFAME